MKHTALAVIVLSVAACAQSEQRAADPSPGPYVPLVLRSPTYNEPPPPMFIGTPRGTVMCQQAWGNIYCN